jgi:lipoate-protein ligase B
VAATGYSSEASGAANSAPPRIIGSRRPCVVHNITNRLVPYVTAWRWQKAAQRRAVDAQREGRAATHPDTLFLVEHPSVNKTSYTQVIETHGLS